MQPLEPDDPPAIGAYRLLRRIGAGGMGRVYLARSAGGRTVAVKVVHPHFAVDDVFRERFRREVAAARRAGGQWTAPVLDAGPDAALPWVATGFVAGPPLHRAVAEHGPLPPASVRALGAGLAEALAHVHGLGLVHRDVKPSNVLLTPEGPRLIDFGIARVVDATASLTTSGVSIGSPGYMSPEQVLGQEVTYASDVFSLGAVLAYAARGEPPFPGDSSASLLYKVVHEEPELDGVDPELRGLVAACLAKQPVDRPHPERIAETLAGPAGGGAAALVRTGWLPGAIVEQVGRQAVELLSLEPGRSGGPESGPVPFTASAYGAPEGGSSAAESPPCEAPAYEPGPARGAFGPPDPSFGRSGGTSDGGGRDAPRGRAGIGEGGGSGADGGSGIGAAAALTAGGRLKVSCTLVVSLACVAAAALMSSYFLHLLPGTGGGGNEGDNPAGSAPGHSSSPSPGGGAGDVPRAFIGRWQGPQAYTDNGSNAGRLTLTLRQGRVGGRIGHGKATLAPLPPCEADVMLKSASPTKLVVRSEVSGSSSLCTGGREEYTLRPGGTLHHVTKYASSNAEGTLHKLDRTPG